MEGDEEQFKSDLVIMPFLEYQNIVNKQGDFPAGFDAILAADPDHPLPVAACIALRRHLRHEMATKGSFTYDVRKNWAVLTWSPIIT